MRWLGRYATVACLFIGGCNRAGMGVGDGPPAPARAKNVILLLADAGGLPTLSAASLLGHGAPQRLYVQSWPHVGLMETTAASEWVTDSAAGMTAIVTGHKTHNEVVSQGTDAVYGHSGTPLKTILEYAEERGLATGVVSDTTIADATPAACYAHANDREDYGGIFLQIFAPRFGDGVDVVLGPGRREVVDAVRRLGKDLESVARAHGRPVLASLDDLAPDARRGIVVTAGPIDLGRAAKAALRALSQSPKGYFLMIESDVHTDDPEAGLRRLVAFDALIRELAGSVTPDTLLVFTADHSFDFRVHAGGPGEPLLKGLPEWRKAHKGSSDRITLPFVRVDDDHTGEEVVAAAMGPGSERVSGFFPNTALFHIMMSAYGWSVASTDRADSRPRDSPVKTEGTP